MLRVDVYNSKDECIQTRFLNPKAIYALNPVSKEVAIEVARQFTQPPVTRWDVKNLLPASATEPDFNDEDDEFGM